MQSKVEKAISFYKDFFWYDLKDIFVSEYIVGGERIFEDLWFFDNENCFQGEVFGRKEDYDA